MLFSTRTRPLLIKTAALTVQCLKSLSLTFTRLILSRLLTPPFSLQVMSLVIQNSAEGKARPRRSPTPSDRGSDGTKRGSFLRLDRRCAVPPMPPCDSFEPKRAGRTEARNEAQQARGVDAPLQDCPLVFSFKGVLSLNFVRT